MTNKHHNNFWTALLTTLSDGKGNLRHWFFDARNLNTTKVHQGNAADAASSSDFYTQNFDALGRVSIKVDQIGTICTMNYDLAGRMTEKQYYTGATPAQGGTITPGGTLESTDTFSYDAASRLTTNYCSSQTNYCYTIKALKYQPKRANTPTGFKGFN